MPAATSSIQRDQCSIMVDVAVTDRNPKASGKARRNRRATTKYRKARPRHP